LGGKGDASRLSPIGTIAYNRSYSITLGLLPVGHQSSRPIGDLIVIAVALALPSAITWVYFFGADEAAAGVQLAIFNVVKVIQFALPIGWVLVVQRGRLSLRPPGSQGVGMGLAFGAAVAAAMFALYALVLDSSELLARATPPIREKVAGFGIDSGWKYAALGVFYSLCHSLLEEYYWRWFVFGQLRRRTTLTTAVAVSSLGFMAHHVLVLGKFFGFASPSTYVFSACVAVGGAAWAWLYDRTGSLLGPWLSHLLVDAAIFAIGFLLVRDLFAS
jgi:membrane protease YdiL (CAAX protease family)